MSWQERRACVGVDPSVFFPEVGQTAQQAKEICASCPVQLDCLRFALENREEFGVWGGLAPWERKGRQRPPKRPPVARCGTDAGYYRHLRQTHTEACVACREAHAVAHRLRKHMLAVVR